MSHQSRNQKLGQGLLWLLCLGVVGYSIVGYAIKPLGSTVHPEMRAVFEEHRVAIYAHIFGSAVALLIGPAQFSQRMRAKHMAWHKKLGWAYLFFGVFVGGLAGLFMARYAFGGLLSQSGFGLLAVLWLATGAMGIRSIKAKDFEAHRKWMVRNFALTFAAVTLRIYLGLAFAAGLAFEDFYPWLGWLSWVPNLLIVEWVLRRPTRRMAVP